MRNARPSKVTCFAGPLPPTLLQGGNKVAAASKFSCILPHQTWYVKNLSTAPAILIGTHLVYRSNTEKDTALGRKITHLPCVKTTR